jgi:hypothetical protein
MNFKAGDTKRKEKGTPSQIFTFYGHLLSFIALTFGLMRETYILPKAIQKGTLSQMITFCRHLLSFRALTLGLMREANILKQAI